MYGSSLRSHIPYELLITHALITEETEVPAEYLFIAEEILRSFHAVGIDLRLYCNDDPPLANLRHESQVSSRVSSVL